MEFRLLATFSRFSLHKVKKLKKIVGITEPEVKSAAPFCLSKIDKLQLSIFPSVPTSRDFKTWDHTFLDYWCKVDRNMRSSFMKNVHRRIEWKLSDFKAIFEVTFYNRVNSNLISMSKCKIHWGWMKSKCSKRFLQSNLFHKALIQNLMESPLQNRVAIFAQFFVCHNFEKSCQPGSLFKTAPSTQTFRFISKSK